MDNTAINSSYLGRYLTQLYLFRMFTSHILLIMLHSPFFFHTGLILFRFFFKFLSLAFGKEQEFLVSNYRVYKSTFFVGAIMYRILFLLQVQ
jgi:hypothetical protein